MLVDDIIDLNILKEDFVNLRIKDYGGVEEAIEHQFVELDCSRVYNNGMRAMQTNIYRYTYEVSMTVALIDRLDDNDLKRKYIQQLNAVHNNNLEFEKDNPPIDYNYKVKKKAAKAARKPKQERFEFDKEVKAEQRLRDKFKQFGGFKLKIGNYDKSNV